MTLLPVAESSTHVIHEFARVQSMTQWWHWLLLAILTMGIVAYVVFMYLRDSVELPKGRSFFLLALRLAALAGVLFFFLDLEKRSERQVVRNSRALLLVDTSLSMGIQDAGSSSSERRVDVVVDALGSGTLIDQLRANHDVVVYRFDESETPVEVASFPKIALGASDGSASDAALAAYRNAVRESRWTAAVAGGVLLVALLALLLYAVTGTAGPEGKQAWAALVGAVGLIAAVVVLGVANLRYPDVDFMTTVGLQPPRTAAELAAMSQRTGADAAEDSLMKSPADVDWSEALAPRGAETHLGDVLRYLVNRERDGSIAGIVVISDGRSNAGIDHEQSVLAAKSAGVPLFAIGLGSATRPANVRIVDLEVPQRVYPGDKFAVSGYVQSFGFAGRIVKVELVSTPAERAAQAAERFEDQRSVKLGDDGEVTPLRFEVTPNRVGSRNYVLRVIAPSDDQDERDNQRTAKVQIVDRKNRVLLWAGGPSREFRFLRNLLFRDRDTTSDVYLQTAEPGASQEANELLFDFPSTPEALFEYDCIVAFDPDWLALDELQIENLERWVAEKAGGLIVVAGPVNTPRWASRLRGDRRIDVVRSLYPVVFYSRGSATLSLGRFASDTPWPLKFTRDGFDAEYLWLEDDALLNEQAWNEFQGVFGYYAVKDPKPGARVLARFSDPNTAIDGGLPIYLASHFYGAGRVFFQASGEMWRIRALDDVYFEQYYTKLIRWASHGRLLRDSSRGVLIVDKDRCSLGDHVTVQAILTDAQFEPLQTEQVSASLEDPLGHSTPLLMRRVQDAARDGMYAGQFTARLEGDYRVELQPPHGAEDELLVREIRSRIPALETERPERNDALLKFVADQTGGAYFVGFDAALPRGGSGTAPLDRRIEPRDQVSLLAGSPDRDFERRLMMWLLGVIGGALCLEWIIRRLSKLA